MTELLVLSAALAVDAAVVSATVGASGVRVDELLRAAVVFGAFQGGMAGLGALAGEALAAAVGPVLPWVAAGLLVGLGARVAFGPSDADEDGFSVGSWRALLGLGVATSIDALAAGVALPVWPIPVMVSVATIAGITFVASFAAGRAGGALTGLLGDRLERVAGIVLIALGVWTAWSAWSG